MGRLARLCAKSPVQARMLCSTSDVATQILYSNHSAVRSQRKAHADTAHSTQHQTDGGLTFGESAMRGLRPTMEDASVATLRIPLPESAGNYALFGIFDGHKGAAAAQFAASNIEEVLSELLAQSDENGVGESIERSFSQLDHLLVASAETSGACALIALVARDGPSLAPCSIVVGNCGDSRAVLGRKDLAPLALSNEHAPGNPVERERIEAAGGEVKSVAYQVGESFSAIDRINGSLAVARALGDSPYKQDTSRPPEAQLVSAVPELTRHAIVPGDEFLLLACDGVWDVMSNEEAVSFVRKELQLASKQCLRVLAENFGSLRIDKLTSSDVSKYMVGQQVDFPKTQSKVKGFVMRTVSDDGSGAGPGTLYVRPAPPEAWEGGWEGESNKDRVAKAWPCGIVCENLIDHCLELGSTDNLSAVLVLLSDDVGMAGHDGSTISLLDGQEVKVSKQQTEAWHRRRNR